MSELTRERARTTRGDGERYFQRLLEALPAAAYTCDAQGLVTFFNHQAVVLWGRAPRLNDPSDRFGAATRLYRDDGTHVPQQESWIARALRERRDFFGEPVVVERPDGTRIRALAHASPIRDERGRVTGAVNVLVDVSAMARAELSVRESENRFRLLAETIPSITWTADATGRITYINDRWYRYTGLAGGTSLQDWRVGTLHPEDQRRVAAAWRRAVAEGRDHRIELRLRRHDGAYRWFEARGVPYRNSAGEVVQWFGTTTDIDDRVRVAHEAEFLARASDELADLSDHRASLQRIAEFAIPAFSDWCGIFLCDEGHRLERLAIAHRDPGKVRFLHAMRDRYPYRAQDPIGPAKVVRTGEPSWGEDLTDAMLASFAHDAGHLAMLRTLAFRSWITVPILLDGRVGGAMSFVLAESGRRYDEAHVRIAEDLARRVSMAIRNRELVEALRESDARKGELLEALRAEQRRKDEFIAMLATELRNPIAPIQNALQQLRPDARGYVERPWAREVIEREMKSLERLVRDLHDVARIGRGHIELRRERLALSTAINAAVETCRPLMERSRVQMTVSTPVEAIRVEGDVARLTQVFGNLLSNAAKFSELGGQVWVTVDREGSQAVVRVRDQGHGIAAENLERIFEPFVQSGLSPERNPGGLGIGLTIARRLVEMHGGSLVARSEGIGRGAEFEVRLPAQ